MMGLPPGINASVTTSDPEVPAGLRIFLNGAEVAPKDAPMQQVARTGQPLHNFEHEVRFADGRRAAIYGSVAPLFDEHGRVRQVIAAYADYTERKRIEEERQRLQAELRAEKALAEQTARRMEILFAITSALSQSVTTKQVAETVVGIVHEKLEASASVIYLDARDDGSLLLAASRGLSPDAERSLLHLHRGSGLPLAVTVRTGEPQWIETHEELLRLYPALSQRATPPEMLQAVVTLPLCNNDGITLGALAFRTDDQNL